MEGQVHNAPAQVFLRGPTARKWAGLRDSIKTMRQHTGELSPPAKREVPQEPKEQEKSGPSRRWKLVLPKVKAAAHSVGLAARMRENAAATRKAPCHMCVEEVFPAAMLTAKFQFRSWLEVLYGRKNSDQLHTEHDS